MNIIKVMSRINLEQFNLIDGKFKEYPLTLVEFCKENNLRPPKIESGNGQALAAMANTPNEYWIREDCDAFCIKFNIQTKDSIQLFNKHDQWGLLCSKERGKNYIQIPYQVSNKCAMRKDFKWDGNEESKNNEINRIKKEIESDYVNVDNKEWQLGHKNPDTTDSSNSNLILQPPIQAKYKDNYIFIDTLTKIPTPKKFIDMDKKGECPYTELQQNMLYDYLKSKYEK